MNLVHQNIKNVEGVCRFRSSERTLKEKSQHPVSDASKLFGYRVKGNGSSHGGGA